MKMVARKGLFDSTSFAEGWCEGSSAQYRMILSIKQ